MGNRRRSRRRFQARRGIAAGRVRTTVFSWMRSCGWPGTPRRGGTCRPRLRPGRRCTPGSGDVRWRLSGTVSSTRRAKTRISRASPWMRRFARRRRTRRLELGAQSFRDGAIEERADRLPRQGVARRRPERGRRPMPPWTRSGCRRGLLSRPVGVAILHRHGVSSKGCRASAASPWTRPKTPTTCVSPWPTTSARPLTSRDPARREDRPVAWMPQRERHLVECFFDRPERSRGIALRREKTLILFGAFVGPACAMDRIR